MIHFPTPTAWQDAPIDPSWLIDSTPHTQIAPLAYHDSLSSGFWQCTAGHFIWHYGVNEAIHILEGAASIRDTAENIWHHLSAGDSVLFPKGASAEWIVDRFVRKFYVIHDKRSLIRRVWGKAKRLGNRS